MMEKEPYGQWQAELDARNSHANKDRDARVEQEENDRTARVEQAGKDRRNQTVVALISAMAAIAAASAVAIAGIDKLSGSPHYMVMDTKTAAGLDTALKIDTKTGNTWVLTQTPIGLAWQPIAP